MKLELLLLLMIGAGAAGTSCGADAGSSSVGGVGGGGGSGGQMGTATGATSGQIAVGGATGTSGGGVGGGFPANCADTLECGNFGAGCVKCASQSSCAIEYQKCFKDEPCKSYSVCIAPCGVKELECLQACATQFPNGAVEYQALTHCVICGDCVALCDHAPDLCK
jgi:hypothetical protein